MDILDKLDYTEKALTLPKVMDILLDMAKAREGEESHIIPSNLIVRSRRLKIESAIEELSKI